MQENSSHTHRKGWRDQAYTLSGKRVYVAGHAGLVGSACVRALRAEGAEIITAPRALLDLRDKTATFDFFKRTRPEVVIMAAARVGGIRANIDFPADFITDNILIQTHLFQAAHQTRVQRLVFLGSSCMYPPSATIPLREGDLMKGPPEVTNAPYAMAKLAGMMMAQSYRRQFGCDFLTLIPCNLYGPQDCFDAQRAHVIPALMAKMHRAKMLNLPAVELWGTGMPLREVMFSDDLAAGILHAVRWYDSGEPLNVGSGTEYRIAELAQAVAQATGYKGLITFNPDHPDGVARKVMDNAHILDSGWRAQTALSDGLAETYEWFCRQDHESLVAAE
jgi:GDP-L-fucose synthase